MKRYRLLTVGTVALAAAVAFAFQQDGFVLRHKISDKKSDAYKFEFASNQIMQMDGPMGAQDMPIDMSAKMKLDADYSNYNEKESKADIALNFKDIEWDLGQAGAMMGGAELPKEMKVNGKVDGRNRLTDIKMPGMAGRQAMMMGMGAGSNPFTSMFIEFPETAVKTGESWSIVSDNPMTKDKKSTMTATLKGEKELNGRAVHIVDLVSDMDVNADLGEIMKDQPGAEMMAGMKMLITGKIKVTGEALVEKSTGRTLQVTLAMKSANVIDMADMGMKMNVNGTTNVKMSLADKA